jgi:hypothetical protein
VLSAISKNERTQKQQRRDTRQTIDSKSTVLVRGLVTCDTFNLLERTTNTRWGVTDSLMGPSNLSVFEGRSGDGKARLKKAVTQATYRWEGSPSLFREECSDPARFGECDIEMTNNGNERLTCFLGAWRGETRGRRASTSFGEQEIRKPHAGSHSCTCCHTKPFRFRFW